MFGLQASNLPVGFMLRDCDPILGRTASDYVTYFHFNDVAASQFLADHQIKKCAVA
jgi:hypothetical protein